jgi:hypothetical protein
MINCLEKVFGPAITVYRITIVFRHKETHAYRTGDVFWVWAEDEETAVGLIESDYNKMNNDDLFLEHALVCNPVEHIKMLTPPNPATQALLDKGKPFRFNIDKPGIFINKWGY